MATLGRIEDDLHKLALERIESILNYLKIEYETRRDDIISIVCPIHGSDCIGNSIIYRDSGVWLCFSGGCSDTHGKSVIGLITGTLKAKGLFTSFNDVVSVIKETSHKVVPVSLRSREATPLFKDEASKPEVILPSKYFLTRGYSENSLRAFEVGDCPRGYLADRAIVPVRYVDGQYMGFSARIHAPLCALCAYHHGKYSTCISSDQDFHFMHRKWYHSKGLQKSRTLYGIHKLPKGSNKVALVEGPGCVWKLFDYGIPAVAALGKDFNSTRVDLLKSLGVTQLLFAPDNDEAGLEFRNRFISSYCKDFSIYFPNLTKKDISEMNDADIKDSIVKKWENM